MPIHDPHFTQIGDENVPVVCPNCGAKTTRDGLSDQQKQYLIDATYYDRFLTEYRHLMAMKAIVDRYPGTQHPLLRKKLEPNRSGFSDERAVAALLDLQPALCDLLRCTTFSLDRRFPSVQAGVNEMREAIFPVLVGCHACPDQYVFLPDDFFLSIGD